MSMIGLTERRWIGTTAAWMVLIAFGVRAMGAEYVGSDKCRICHLAQYKSWKETKMGQALDALKPGVRVEAKKAAKLDPSKDYTKEAKCLACHTVGFGRKSGYRIPGDGNAAAQKEAASFAHVGCESCHGAGGSFVAFHKEIMLTSRKYDQQEMFDAGVNKIDEATCKSCHNADSPTFKEFDFAKGLKEGIHKSYPLRFRKG